MKKKILLRIIFLSIVSIFMVSCASSQKVNIQPSILSEEEKSKFPVKLKITKDTVCEALFTTLPPALYHLKKGDELGAYSTENILTVNADKLQPLPNYAVSFLVGSTGHESSFVYILLQKSGEVVFENSRFMIVYKKDATNNAVIADDSIFVCTSNKKLTTDFYEIID